MGVSNVKFRVNRTRTCLGRIREDIEVQPKVALLSHGHVVTDHLDRWMLQSEIVRIQFAQHTQ